MQRPAGQTSREWKKYQILTAIKAAKLGNFKYGANKRKNMQLLPSRGLWFGEGSAATGSQINKRKVKQK